MARRPSPLPAWPRLLRRSNAAAYCGFSVPTFVRICDVAPLDLGNRLQRWDRHDLDGWIDRLKGHSTEDESDRWFRLHASGIEAGRSPMR